MDSPVLLHIDLVAYYSETKVSRQHPLQLFDPVLGLLEGASVSYIKYNNDALTGRRQKEWSEVEGWRKRDKCGSGEGRERIVSKKN